MVRENKSVEACDPIRKRIFELLDKKGVSQSDLADYLGITHFVVSEWKRGLSTSFTKSQYLKKMAEYFHVSVEYLIGTSDNKVPGSHGKELDDYLQQLKDRPEMRTLFKTAKGATKEDVEQAIKIIEALKK